MEEKKKEREKKMKLSLPLPPISLAASIEYTTRFTRSPMMGVPSARVLPFSSSTYFFFLLVPLFEQNGAFRMGKAPAGDGLRSKHGRRKFLKKFGKEKLFDRNVNKLKFFPGFKMLLLKGWEKM